MIREAFVQAGILKPDVLGERSEAGSMTPLKAAKDLAGSNLLEISDQSNDCPFCGGFRIGRWGESRPDAVVADQWFDHYPDCSWIAMPQIVEVLTLVNNLMVSEDGAEPIEGEVWAFCQRPAGGPHGDGCLWERLRALAYTGVNVG